MTTIAEYSDDGKYNIKSVSLRTGVQPVTLRAWERRYNILNPHRADNGYRLYSERDVALLSWLKKQIDAGVSISAAVADFKTDAGKGISPEAVLATPAPLASKSTAKPSADFYKNLFEALVAHDEKKAAEIFEQSLASFSLLALFEQVIIPTLVEIGEAWFHGRIFVATEHFASGFILSKLLAIYQSLPVGRPQPFIMIGGAPGELHEIGSLMIAVLLREMGYRVEYLGPDLPIDDLIFYAKGERPKMIVLSATLEDSILALRSFDKALESIHPKPIFGFGGAAFVRHPELVSRTPGIFLGETITQSTRLIQDLLKEQHKEPLVN